MYWMVTDSKETEMFATTFGSIPFKQTKAPDNVFLSKSNDLVNEGKHTMTWAFNYVPGHNQRSQDLVTDLNEYSKNNTDENWNKVKEAFVEGWEKQYQFSIGNKE